MITAAYDNCALLCYVALVWVFSHQKLITHIYKQDEHSRIHEHAKIKLEFHERCNCFGNATGQTKKNLDF